MFRERTADALALARRQTRIMLAAMTESTLAGRWEGWSSRLRSVLRIAAAFMFLQAGTTKLFGFPAPAPDHLSPQILAAGVIETLGATLLLLGLFARPAAFILSGEMAVAYFQVHFPRGFWPVLNGGQTAALYCFIWLYLSAAGPGPWSVDAAIARRRSAAG
jgi:putative oxidoreductase